MNLNTDLDFTALKPTPVAPLASYPSVSTPTSKSGPERHDEFIRPAGAQSTASQAALKPANIEKVSVSDQDQSRITWADIALSTAVAIGVAGGVLAAALLSPWIALGLVFSLFPIGAVLLASPRATRDSQPKPECTNKL